MTYAELINQDCRRRIIDVLHKDCGYEHNESVLRLMLAETGNKVSRDQVRTLLAWLEEQGLVVLRDVSGYLVAGLTGRGVDVAEGSTIVPGVKRPDPRG